VKSSDYGRSALDIGAIVALLSGCGGLQPPVGTPGTISNASSRGFKLSTVPFVQPTVKSPARKTQTPDYKVSGPSLYVTDAE
jgi:hypothetical protein